MNKNGGFSFVKFYFTIVSIVSVIGMAIAFGIAIYQQGMQMIITDDEYLSSRGHWEVKQCEEPEYMGMKPIPVRVVDGIEPEAQETIKEKTPAEIDACKTEAKERVKQERRFSTKEATIGGITRGVIFLILFLTHYPRMLETQETTSVKKPTTRKRTTRKRIAKK